METGPGPTPRAPYADSRTSQATSSQSQSDHDCSTSGEAKRRDESRIQVPTKSHGGKPRWLKQMKSWLSVSEPSAQAMKNQRDSTYKKYGIDKQDPQAAAKMHLPIGKIPEGVTTSTKGPKPEKALKERTKEAMAKQAYLGRSESLSMSSGISSDASTKEAKQIAPWA